MPTVGWVCILAITSLGVYGWGHGVLVLWGRVVHADPFSASPLHFRAFPPKNKLEKITENFTRSLFKGRGCLHLKRQNVKLEMTRSVANSH